MCGVGTILIEAAQEHTVRATPAGVSLLSNSLCDVVVLSTDVSVILLYHRRHSVV